MHGETVEIERSALLNVLKTRAAFSCLISSIRDIILMNGAAFPSDRMFIIWQIFNPDRPRIIRTWTH